MHTNESPERSIVPLEHRVARETFAGLSDGLYAGHSQFSELRENHLQASHKTIEAAAQMALDRVEPGNTARAIIFGAGTCADIPLARLAASFGHTTLVDVSIQYTLQARDSLPMPLRSKVEVVAQDITGIIDEATAWMAHPFDSHHAYLSCAANVFAGIRPCDKVPKFEEPYDFVASHLVHDQFGPSLARIVREEAYKRFGFARSSSGAHWHDRYWREQKALDDRLQQAHFDLLADTVNSSGVVHFAGSYNFRYNDQPRAGRRPIDLLGGRFALLSEPQEWQWRLTPGRLCDVAAYALQVAE